MTCSFRDEAGLAEQQGNVFISDTLDYVAIKQPG